MNNRPNSSGGRKKNVTSGNGSGVRKRQSAVVSKRPVGRADGYSGRTGSSGGYQSSSSGGDRGYGTRASGGLICGLLGLLLGGLNKKGSGLKKILTIIVVAVVVIVLLKKCANIDVLGSLLGDQGGMNTGDNGIYLSDSYDASDSTAQSAATSSTSTDEADMSVSNKARDKRTVIKGNGEDVFTIMVYMCGTDLETEYGMATSDLNEMLHAELDNEHINLIVETGGTKKWKNKVISNNTNQRYRVTSEGLVMLDDSVGKKNMTDPDTLTDFIDFCTENYPANRYALIFWDHGGGAISGYGYDQHFSGSMTLDEIDSALKKSGAKFDFIGFDACLMATMETALVAEQYADYLIASEETEPGCGWYYTDWLTALSKNPSMSTVEIGENIIDDFIDVCRKNAAGDKTTLSIVDLAEFAGTVPEVFSDFAASVGDLLDNEEYAVVSTARGNAREFGSSAQINHVDLVHLAKGIGTDEAKALTEAILGCVKYNRTSKAMTNSYGMSIYFPYDSFKSVNSAMSLYSDIGMDRNYSSCIKSFASLAAGGQIATGTTSSPLGSLLGSFTGTSSSSSSSDVLGSLLSGALGSGSGSGGSDLLTSIMGSDYSSWFDSGRVLAMGDYYDEHAIYSDDMLLTDKNGGKVLSLSDDKWELVKDIQLNVFVDDGEGFIDLGMDNVYEFDADGDLVIDYDGTWLAINDNIVAYYMESYVTDGDDYVITGRIPALLNGELVYIMVVFDNETPENENGYVVGARYIYDEGETDTVGKGLIELKYGDRIDFVCDYYTYDGEYEASYLLGETFIVNGELTISNVPVGDVDCVVTYCLTDIYANEFWTESLIF